MTVGGSAVPRGSSCVRVGGRGSGCTLSAGLRCRGVRRRYSLESLSARSLLSAGLRCRGVRRTALACCTRTPPPAEPPHRTDGSFWSPQWPSLRRPLSDSLMAIASPPLPPSMRWPSAFLPIPCLPERWPSLARTPPSLLDGHHRPAPRRHSLMAFIQLSRHAISQPARQQSPRTLSSGDACAPGSCFSKAGL